MRRGSIAARVGRDHLRASSSVPNGSPGWSAPDRRGGWSRAGAATADTGTAATGEPTEAPAAGPATPRGRRGAGARPVAGPGGDPRAPGPLLRGGAPTHNP